MVSIGTEVEKVVVEMIRNRRLFTAHDITKILRHRLDGESIRHNDVKKEVHTLYDNDGMGLYSRTQIGVGTKVSPFVYHLNHQDPSTDYSKDWVDTVIGIANNTGVNPIDGSPISLASVSGVRPTNRVGNAPTPVIQKPVASNVKITKALRAMAAGGNDGFFTRTVTNEGRLSIPVSMICGFKIGDHAYVKVGTVLKNSQTVQALIVSTDPSNSIKGYVVNSDGRLRISSKFLNKIGSSSIYSVKSVNNTIVVVLS